MELPRDKFDLQCVEALKAEPLHLLRPHIPELLEWLKDMNWPVARPVAELLANCGNDLVEPVRKVLRGDDAIWKAWVLSELLCHTTANVRIELQEEVLRLLKQPTSDERCEGVVEAARDVYFLLCNNDL